MSRFPDRLTRSRMAPAVAATVAAVVAAVLVLLLRRWVTSEWRFLEFGEDLIRNVLIATLLSIATFVIEDARRKARDAEEARATEAKRRLRVERLLPIARVTPNAWNLLPPDEHGTQPAPDPSETIKLFRSSAQELLESRAGFVAVHSGQMNDPERYRAASMLRFALEGYIAEGMRVRRFQWLEYLSGELLSLDDATDSSWSVAVDDFRTAVRTAAGWKSHTDACVLEALVVGRDSALDQSAPRDVGLFLRPDLGSAATSFDVEYLLLTYLRLLADLIELADINLVHVINRSIGALRNEMFWVAHALSAFIPILEQIAIDETRAMA